MNYENRFAAVKNAASQNAAGGTEFLIGMSICLIQEVWFDPEVGRRFRGITGNGESRREVFFAENNVMKYGGLSAAEVK